MKGVLLASGWGCEYRDVVGGLRCEGRDWVGGGGGGSWGVGGRVGGDS